MRLLHKHELHWASLLPAPGLRTLAVDYVQYAAAQFYIPRTGIGWSDAVRLLRAAPPRDGRFALWNQRRGQWMAN